MQNTADPAGLRVTASQHAAAKGCATSAAPSVALQGRVQEAATLLKALANPDRLLLLCQLVAGERSVTDLGALSGLAQPTLSQQLGVLRGERLVSTRRDGKSVIYRVSSAEALAILQTLYSLYCAVPTALPPNPANATVARRAQKDPA